MKILGYCAGQDRIPLLGDKSKPVHKPEMDITISEDGVLARICGRIDTDSPLVPGAQLLTIIANTGELHWRGQVFHPQNPVDCGGS